MSMDSYKRVASESQRPDFASNCSGAELTPAAPTPRRRRAATPPHLDGAAISGEGAAMRSESSSKSKSRKRRRSKSRKRRRKNPGDPTASLTDDIMFNILSRLPVKSFCRCKAVSPRWRCLISHEDYSRKFPQTLPCLIYSTFDYEPWPPKETWHVVNVWEGPTPKRPLVSPSLSFLPSGYTIVNCCNGMLLCYFSESNSRDALRYAVCNPAEMTMVVLPDSGRCANWRVPVLAFDPASYPEFHVLEFVMNVEINPRPDPKRDDEYVVGANIYSSVTGAWNYKESGWPPMVRIYTSDSLAFFNGFLHFQPWSDKIMVVDVKGEKWRSIPCPYNTIPQFVGMYKGHLCYVSWKVNRGALSFWILEDYTKYDWTMKHQVSLRLLCEKQLTWHRKDFCHVVGILPDCNFVLYITESGTLMAYDMDSEEVYAIQNLKRSRRHPFILYVPFYTG